MLKTEKIRVVLRAATETPTSLIQQAKVALYWRDSTVASAQQHSTKRRYSYSVHIVATAPKLSPAVRNKRETVKFD